MLSKSKRVLLYYSAYKLCVYEFNKQITVLYVIAVLWVGYGDFRTLQLRYSGQIVDALATDGDEGRSKLR